VPRGRCAAGPALAATRCRAHRDGTAAATLAAAPARGAEQAPAATATGARLDINTATAAELEALPGIGPALAGRIVAYREGHGPFSTVEELLNVDGIGAKTLAGLQPFVAVR
jgi:competence protein ComEA